METRRKSGKEDVIERLQASLRLSTRKEAEVLVRVFESCLEDTLVEHLAEDGYSIKLGGFGKFAVRHRPPMRRKVGFTGETTVIPQIRKVKFVGLGRLRRLERLC